MNFIAKNTFNVRLQNKHDSLGGDKITPHHLEEALRGSLSVLMFENIFAQYETKQQSFSRVSSTADSLKLI